MLLVRRLLLGFGAGVLRVLVGLLLSGESAVVPYRRVESGLFIVVEPLIAPGLLAPVPRLSLLDDEKDRQHKRNAKANDAPPAKELESDGAHHAFQSKKV